MNEDSNLLLETRKHLKARVDAINDQDKLDSFMAFVLNLTTTHAGPIVDSAPAKDTSPPSPRTSRRKDPNSPHLLHKRVLEDDGIKNAGATEETIFNSLRHAGLVSVSWTLADTRRVLTRGSPATFRKLPNNNWILRKYLQPLSLRPLSA